MANQAPETVDLRRSLGQLVSVLIGIVLVTVYIEIRSRRVTAAPKDEPAVAAAPTPAKPAEEAAPEPEQPPPPPPIDRAAVTTAEGELDAASRDRARAEHRADTAARQLALAAATTALETANARKLGFQIHDPSSRIIQAASRGGFVKGERDKIEKELSTLRNLPRPKTRTILSKSPVSRPATAAEFHFELKSNRVSFIDLDHLIDLVKADAQVRLRMSDRSGVISARVGPIGSFALTYELARAAPGSVDELLERKSTRFNLQAWELVPESDRRGENYETTRNPLSEYSRAINRMDSGRSTVTMWVYPDSFVLYRRLRDELIERGFSVAGRPLPEGMTIRGSPMGSQSAAQ